MSNLLPEIEKRAITSLYKKRLVVVLCAGLSIVLAISILLILPSLRVSKIVETALIEKKTELSGKETNTIKTSLLRVVATINARLAVFDSSTPASPIVDSFIDPVLKAKTDSVRLSRFSYSVPTGKKSTTSGATIQISGTAQSREALLVYAENLRKTEGITNVVVPITSFIQDQNVPFVITATVSIK